MMCCSIQLLDFYFIEPFINLLSFSLLWSRLIKNINVVWCILLNRNFLSSSQVSAFGSKRKIHTDTSSVGQKISTKAVDNGMRDDITHSYKYREGKDCTCKGMRQLQNVRFRVIFSLKKQQNTVWVRVLAKKWYNKSSLNGFVTRIDRTIKFLYQGRSTSHRCKNLSLDITNFTRSQSTGTLIWLLLNNTLQTTSFLLPVKQVKSKTQATVWQ